MAESNLRSLLMTLSGHVFGRAAAESHAAHRFMNEAESSLVSRPSLQGRSSSSVLDAPSCASGSYAQIDHPATSNVAVIPIEKRRLTKVPVLGTLDTCVEVELMTTVATGNVVLEIGKVEVLVGAVWDEVGSVVLAVPLQYAVPTAVEVPAVVFVTVLDSVLHVGWVSLNVVKEVDIDELVRVVVPDEIKVRVMRRPEEVKICVAVVV